jgi:hypothetical protein
VRAWARDGEDKGEGAWAPMMMPLAEALVCAHFARLVFTLTRKHTTALPPTGERRRCLAWLVLGVILLCRKSLRSRPVSFVL